MLRSLVNKIRGGGKNDEWRTEENSLLARLDVSKLPAHVAVIMDGNGRWATKRGLPRGMGHRIGVESLREMVTTCSELGIQYLTVYAFSTENWKRPAEEVNILMDLLVEYLEKEIEELHKENVRINALGKLEQLPLAPLGALNKAMDKTRYNNGLVLNLCLNYGGRQELTDGIKEIAKKTMSGQLNWAEIDEQVVADHLYTAGMPDPDILIRPAGELRISNYLLWQLAYTEFWLSPVLWPDFRRIHLLNALFDYQKRNRRFGGL
ncbi:MAG: isoprenyl transferase [Carboxydocellales bacterium]